MIFFPFIPTMTLTIKKNPNQWFETALKCSVVFWFRMFPRPLFVDFSYVSWRPRSVLPEFTWMLGAENWRSVISGEKTGSFTCLQVYIYLKTLGTSQSDNASSASCQLQSRCWSAKPQISNNDEHVSPGRNTQPWDVFSGFIEFSYFSSVFCFYRNSHSFSVLFHKGAWLIFMLILSERQLLYPPASTALIQLVNVSWTARQLRFRRDFIS